jgi:hypothetical protein
MNASGRGKWQGGTGSCRSGQREKGVGEIISRQTRVADSGMNPPDAQYQHLKPTPLTSRRQRSGFSKEPPLTPTQLLVTWTLESPAVAFDCNTSAFSFRLSLEGRRRLSLQKHLHSGCLEMHKQDWKKIGGITCRRAGDSEANRGVCTEDSSCGNLVS